MKNVQRHNRAGPDGGNEPADRGTGALPAMAGRALVGATDVQRDEDTERFNANHLISIITKWKWVILGSLLASILIAVLVTLVMTPIYRATVMMEVNSSPADVMGSQTEVQPQSANQDEFLTTQYGLLRSRALAEKVADTLNLANDPSFAGGATPAARRRSAAGRLAGNFEITPQPGGNLIELAYSDENAERAAAIANAFAQSFIYTNLERRYDATAFARQFLQNRLAAIRTKLEQTERQLVDYAAQHGILDLKAGETEQGTGGGGGDSLSAQSLITLNQALTQATTDRIIAEQRYRSATTNKTATQVIDSPTVQQLRGQRDLLQADYDQKLATFKPDLPDMIAMRSRMKSIDQAIAAQSTEVTSSLRAAVDEARGREQRLGSQVASTRSNVLNLRDRGIQYTILQREVDTNRSLYDALLQRYKEIGVAGGVGESQASIVDQALRPSRPARPIPLLNVGAGAVLGLVLGLSIAFGIELIDDTIKSPEDVLGKLKVPLLGLIPKLPKGEEVSESLQDQRSHVAESYLSAMTSLQFSTPDGMPRTILVSSSRAAEGKTSSSLAFARGAARMGASTVLVDADLRKPSFKSGGDVGGGLVKLLTSADSALDHVVPTYVENLSLLPSGHIPPNPAELIASGRINAIVRELVEAFDVVIIDGPPVLGLADSPLLSSICDATVMVVETGMQRRRVLNSLRRLFEANGRVVGVLLTKYNVKGGGYGYGYGYGDAYGYGEQYGDPSKARALIDMAS